jgi:outer membrane protein TolC
LFNLADRRAWQSARSQKEYSRLQVENARELVALNVIATYLQAMTNKTTRDSLTSQRKLAEELYGSARDRVNHGVAAELDAIRAMQQVNTLLQQSQEAEQDYVATKLTLANILQARITSEFDVADKARNAKRRLKPPLCSGPIISRRRRTSKPPSCNCSRSRRPGFQPNKN